jgi:hypothetical protein
MVRSEVTHDDSEASGEPSVPLPLLHGLLHHHFRDKEKTRITTNTKELLGKYMEV